MFGTNEQEFTKMEKRHVFTKDLLTGFACVSDFADCNGLECAMMCDRDTLIFQAMTTRRQAAIAVARKKTHCL